MGLRTALGIGEVTFTASGREVTRRTGRGRVPSIVILYGRMDVVGAVVGTTTFVRVVVARVAW